MSLSKRKLGNQGLTVSAIGLGVMPHMTQLDDALRPGNIAGPRYGEQIMATIDR